MHSIINSLSLAKMQCLYPHTNMGVGILHCVITTMFRVIGSAFQVIGSAVGLSVTTV